MSRERPILMSAPMVRACLREPDPKTQTRRVVKPQPDWLPEVHSAVRANATFWPMTGAGRGHQCGAPIIGCPYGVPGDVLWVRENFRLELGARKPADAEGYLVHFQADGDRPNPEHEWGKQHPSIHMPRWASRLTLCIADVRVERLQDISERDALAEGLFTWSYPDCDGDPRLDGCMYEAKGFHWREPEREADGFGTARRAYQNLWESINGAGSWAANPWVWAVSFERVA